MKLFFSLPANTIGKAWIHLFFSLLPAMIILEWLVVGKTFSPHVWRNKMEGKNIWYFTCTILMPVVLQRKNTQTCPMIELYWYCSMIKCYMEEIQNLKKFTVGNIAIVALPFHGRIRDNIFVGQKNWGKLWSRMSLWLYPVTPDQASIVHAYS